MVFTGTKALQLVSIPIYTILKKGVIIMVAVGETIWFNGSINALAVVSFMLVIASSVIFAWPDIQREILHHGDVVLVSNAGYFWMFMNCVCTSAYALAMRKQTSQGSYKTYDGTSTPSY